MSLSSMVIVFQYFSSLSYVAAHGQVPDEAAFLMVSGFCSMSENRIVCPTLPPTVAYQHVSAVSQLPFISFAVEYSCMQ